MARRNSDGARNERVANDIHGLLAAALRQEVKDPRVSAVSITKVRVSRDLSIAHVNVVPLGGLGDGDDMLEGLNAATGFLRRLLGQRLRMRHTPQLRFHLDDGLDASVAMTSRLLDMEAARSDDGDSDVDGDDGDDGADLDADDETADTVTDGE